MRVLFVSQEISYEPHGIMFLSAVLKQAGHDVSLTVANVEDPVAHAVAYQPDILVYSVLTGSQRGYFNLNQRIRQAVNPLRESAGKPPVFSVFGGPHPTFFPETINEPGVDGVCIGEGEGAMVDLANALVSRNGSFKTDHSILVFPSEDDRQQREHFQRLFALGVEFPRLEGLILKLIKLPHNKLVDTVFWWFHKLHKGFAIYSRVYPFRPGPIELVKTALHFMRIKS